MKVELTAPQLQTGGLRLKAKSPLRRSDSPEDRQPETKYFGGPLFNIPGLIDPSTVFIDKDGTHLVFDVDPRLAAKRNPTVPVGQKKNYIFPPADLSHLIFSKRFEVHNSVSISSVHINKTNRLLHLYAANLSKRFEHGIHRER